MLVWIDGSLASDRALAYAAGVARRSRSHLVCARAIAPTAVADTFALVAGLPTNTMTKTDLRVAVLGHLRGAVPDVAVDVYMLHGQPASALRRLATSLRIDLVVVAAPGRSRLPRPSLAKKLGRDPGCTLMVIP